MKVGSNQMLKVKLLKDSRVNVSMWQVKPCNELKQLSMFLNPKPYLIKASRFSTLKDDTRQFYPINRNLNGHIIKIIY